MPKRRLLERAALIALQHFHRSDSDIHTRSFASNGEIETQPGMLQRRNRILDVEDVKKETCLTASTDISNRAPPCVTTIHGANIDNASRGGYFSHHGHTLGGYISCSSCRAAHSQEKRTASQPTSLYSVAQATEELVLT